MQIALARGVSKTVMSQTRMDRFGASHKCLRFGIELMGKH